MKYIALLRGINVGGNNKVSMSDLKTCFIECGYQNVSTYINSGNVIFETSKQSETGLVEAIEDAIEKRFGFKVVTAIIAADELSDSLDHAPSWWDKGDGKHNAIFVIAPMTSQQIMDEVGQTKPEYEKVSSYGKIIFWSAPFETFSRTRYSKIVGTKAYQNVTIRNANTTKKLRELCE